MTVYEHVKRFKKKFPLTIAWRLKRNSKVLDMHVNPDEKVRYAFAAQKHGTLPFVSTCVVAITNKRILIGQKRVLFGYFYYSITPDLYNDIQIIKRIVWGDLIIDTVKEVIVLTKISPKALLEIETEISSFMMEEKQKYKTREESAEKNVDNL